MKGRARGVRYIPIALLLLAFVLAGCFGPSTPTPATGTIAVTSEPEGAKVFLDGKDTGKTTPAELKDVSVGNREITVALAGFELVTDQVAVTAGQTVAVSFELTPGEVSFEIAGTVTGADGPLEGATVTVLAGDESDVASGMTDDEGNYSLFVAPGAYTVRAEASGYYKGERSMVVGSESTVRADFALVSFNEEPPAVGHVHGTVTEGVEGDVLFGASVTAYEKGTDVAAGSTLTDEEGDYSIIVPFGEYDIVAHAGGYGAVTKSVNVTTATATKLSFELNPAPIVVNGHVAGDEHPFGIPNATVVVRQDGEEVEVLTADGDGAFRATLEHGTYDFTASAPYYFEHTQSLTVAPGGEVNLSFDLEHIGMGVLSGTVVANRGGSTLPGMTVTAYAFDTGEAVDSTVTDDSGFYSLRIPTGTYDIVTGADGRAQGKRQALDLGVDEEVTFVDLVSKRIFMPGGKAEAPTLSLTFDDGTPFMPGDIIDDLELVHLDFEGEYPLTVIQAWVGNRHHTPDFNGTTTFLLWDLFDAPGETYLRVAVYDVQENWTEMVVPFTYAVGESAEAPAQVHGVDLIAFTYGEDLGLYRVQREEHFERLGLAGDPDMFDIGDGTLIDLSTIRDDVTLYTVIRWDDVVDAWGYAIERASTAHGPWERIGKVSDGFGQPYMDFSAALQPDKRMYYRVRAIGMNGEEGPPSTPVWVEHLPRYEVQLVSPTDDAVDVPLEPTFSWTHTDVGADVYLFEGFVSAVTREPGGEPLTDYYTWVFETENETKLQYGESGILVSDLKPAKRYSWNVDESRAIKFFGPTSVAVSLSGPDVGAVNGEFTFTTVTERSDGDEM